MRSGRRSSRNLHIHRGKVSFATTQPRTRRFWITNFTSSAVTSLCVHREGATECWWLRIRDGTRQTLSKPRPIPISGTTTAIDPRRHILSDADVGCTLKVKVRPVRSDFAQGEVATSKASGTVREKSSPVLPTPPPRGASPTTPSPPPPTTDALIRKPIKKEINGFEVAL